MFMFKRLITAIFLTVISVILLLSAVGAYLIVTPLGGKLLVRYFKQEFSSVGILHIGHYEGSLHEGFILKDVRITGLSYLPNALVRIQEIKVHLPLWDLPHSDFTIFNARLFIPDSDPIVFTGKIYAGQVKGNLYANSVDIHEAIRFCPIGDIGRKLQGYLSNVDLSIQGPLSSLRVNGSFMAESIQYKSTFLTDCSSFVGVTLWPDLRPLQLIGKVIINSGLVNVRHTNLGLQQSTMMFQGDVLNPSIDIHLGAKVEDMDINLAIKGVLMDPQLIVSSDPPMTPQDALQVLFTGNALSASTSPFNGVTSTELAQNFLNYSFQDTGTQQQLGLKTKLTDNLKLGAEMDQMPSAPGETNTYYYRRINGEMDMTDHMSLNVSRQVMAQDSYPSYEASQPEDETQVYMQYKKRF